MNAKRTTTKAKPKRAATPTTQYTAPPTPEEASAPTRVEVINESFARRLRRIMLEKNVSQADLARRIWGTDVDSRGQTVAKNRNRISVYLKGNTTPNDLTLMQIAKALGVELTDLSPDIDAKAMKAQKPAVTIATLTGDDMAVLTVDITVPFSVAIAVAKLIDDAVGNAND